MTNWQRKNAKEQIEQKKHSHTHTKLRGVSFIFHAFLIEWNDKFPLSYSNFDSS